MPTTSRGKTQTIKRRAVYVYLPSIDMIEDWKRRAQDAGQSVSKFVVERVEDSLSREEGRDEYRSRIDLITKLRDCTAQVKQLSSDNRMLRKLVENQDTELKRYRAQPFLDEAFTGVRRFEQDLIAFLRRGGSQNGDAILAHLNIDPTDYQLIKAINKQLELLASYGLVEYSGRGWAWKPST